MENVGAVLFKESAVPEPGKTNQVKNNNGEFAELLADTLGLPVMCAGAFPGLAMEPNIESQDTLLSKNDVLLNETLVNENLVNVKLVNEVKVLANQVGENSSFTLEALMNPAAPGLNDNQQQDRSGTITLENMASLVEMKLKSAREGSSESYFQLNSAEEGLNNQREDVNGEALQQVNVTDFDLVTDVKNGDYTNLLQMDAAGGEILKAKLVEDAQTTKNFVEVNNDEKVSNYELNTNKKANKNEQVNKEKVNNSKENLVEPKNDLAMKLETSWLQATPANNGKTPHVPVMENVVNAEHLAQDLPEIVLSKLKTFENKDGSKDVLIHLEPKELGKLVVKLTSVEGMVSVKIMAHYPLTRDLLESGLNNLRQSLLEQGISFDRLDVELGGQQLNQSQYQHQEPQTWRRDKGYYERSAGPETNSYLENEPPEQMRGGSLLETGRYDYLV